jgi:hypothetical protein
MTRVKSLKYEVEKSGKGYIHRTHRSKKNRNYIHPVDLSARRDKRKRIEELREEELDLDSV